MDADYRAAKQFDLSLVRELYEEFEAANIRDAQFTCARAQRDGASVLSNVVEENLQLGTAT